MKMTAETKKTVMTQFENAKTYEELKKAYVERVLECKGNASACKFLDTAFGKCVDAVKNIHANKDGDIYEKEPTETPKEFIALINALAQIDGVSIEQCGTWLWVGGDKDIILANSDALKGNGFHYAASKKMWYKAPKGAKHYKNKTSWKMSQIRDAYGSTVIADADDITE